MMEERYYTTDELAGVLRVKAITVREWIRSGRLPASKPGKSYLVSEHDLKNFLKERNG